MCSGSLAHIGLSCLKEWLEGKKHFKETDQVNSYIWKQLECEICKAPFSDEVANIEGKMVKLLNYNIHEESQNYAVLESVT